MEDTVYEKDAPGCAVISYPPEIFYELAAGSGKAKSMAGMRTFLAGVRGYELGGAGLLLTTSVRA